MDVFPPDKFEYEQIEELKQIEETGDELIDIESEVSDPISFIFIKIIYTVTGLKSNYRFKVCLTNTLRQMAQLQNISLKMQILIQELGLATMKISNKELKQAMQDIQKITEEIDSKKKGEKLDNNPEVESISKPEVDGDSQSDSPMLDETTRIKLISLGQSLDSK